MAIATRRIAPRVADQREKWITVPEVLAELGIARRTWQRWRALGKTPECSRLPNGELRMKLRDFQSWMESLAETRKAS
ncbi:helix-turn-helix domain-containing protein [Sphaerisporangium sp. NPDC051017]|uniref:helix-turn-helix transcriptional regulator n=1 Tax=Sphaerisporangium sp. NPDC051017 TaxID=3154636 RepID=UPI00341F29AA